MKKIPYGISNYEELIEDGYYYVDKTMYIEKLENLAEKRIMFLRPRKFGKTLFTSTIENYYDINKKEKFEKLYGETYIGKNPTKLKNGYHILRFNFSGIDSRTEETTIKSFKDKVQTSIQGFVGYYKLDFYINPDQTAEAMLDSIFQAFKIQRPEEKIYVIIDEYDHFANELLGFSAEKFKELVSRNGKIRKWYETLKQGTETVVDRIFITGVAPITLDSMTSGFNIVSDITRDLEFNEMLGFTKKELIEMMKHLDIDSKNQEMLLPILKENYDGYKFSTKAQEKIYNSNMCLYLLKDYIRYKELPESLVDVNIVSDYSKLGNMLNICEGEERINILKKTISGEGVTVEITQKFNPETGFGEKEFVSMLFYLGYLTISGERLGKTELQIPNVIMREIYSSYFIEILNKSANLRVEESRYNEILEDLAINGEIKKLTELLHEYLNNLSNRDFQRFDEKYVKLICYCIVRNFKMFSIKSELEVNRNYPDLLMIPRDRTRGYKSVMIEFKYLKKEDAGRLMDKQKEARAQIEKYGEFDDIKSIDGLNRFTVVVVNDEVFVERVVE